MTHHGKGPRPTAAGWDEQGCDVCRTQWMQGQRPMLVRVDAASHETLYRCGTCGTFWVETERFATAIDATAAARFGAESAGAPSSENGDHDDRWLQRVGNSGDAEHTVQFTDTFFSRDDRYSVGVEAESGRFYLSIPVSNGLVDYEEYYELARDQYEHFQTDREAAAAFADECRRHEHDELLILKPGWNRGTPV